MTRWEMDLYYLEERMLLLSLSKRGDWQRLSPWPNLRWAPRRPFVTRPHPQVLEPCQVGLAWTPTLAIWSPSISDQISHPPPPPGNVWSPGWPSAGFLLSQCSQNPPWPLCLLLVIFHPRSPSAHHYSLLFGYSPLVPPVFWIEPHSIGGLFSSIGVTFG